MDIERQQSVGLIIIRPKNPQFDRKSDRLTMFRLKKPNRTVCLTHRYSIQTQRKGNMLLGNKIRSLRDEQGILQRQVAAYLEIDTSMFSKIERGDRRAKRSQVIQMATYFKVDEKEMLTLWLADKVLDALEGEDELKLTAIETAKDELMDINR